MSARLPVTKTCKLFINGAFPRSESGRSLPVADRKGHVVAHVAHASRKDLRDAVEAARAAQPRWTALTAYNRGQILYRMAEMIEAGRAEFIESLRAATVRERSARERARIISVAAARREVDASIDRLVCFAGWADKFAQVMGCQNPVAGPYYNFTAPEPTGIVGVVCPDEPALLGMVSMLAAALCAGNAIVLIGSDLNPLPAVALGEACATSDVPGGVINILTGQRDELLEHLANHREVNAISAAGVDAKQAKLLQLGVAENLKRMHIIALAGRDWFDSSLCESPEAIEPFVEFKTIWHPSAT